MTVRHRRKLGHSRRRHGHSVAMRVHGQLFMEPETAPEARDTMIDVGDLGLDLTPPAAMRSEELVLAGYGHSRRRR